MSLRPVHVANRDRAVAVQLVAETLPLTEIVNRINVNEAEHDRSSRHDVYRSLCRLRSRGLVSKVGTGSRTPNWGLTAEGVAFAQEVQAGGSPDLPPAPAETPAPTPEPPFVVLPEAEPPIAPPPVVG